MRHFNRFIILSSLLFSSSSYAIGLFLEGIDWRPTETNDWAYVNSLTVPNQTLQYKTMDFAYSPGYRLGVNYVNNWDALLSYTHLDASMNDAATGNIQPAFLGSVTAKPATSYLYKSGQVRQRIAYNIYDLDVGMAFNVANRIMLHPIVGLMGGWIDQAIYAAYQGSTSSNEKLINNFAGIGPKVGIDTSIRMFDYNGIQPNLIAAFAASYLLGNWDISDTTVVTPTHYVIVNGANRSMGAFTLQGSLGFKIDYQKFSAKFAYEMADWFDQSQFFDNDTGVHNNDLAFQGLTLGVSYTL